MMKLIRFKTKKNCVYVNPESISYVIILAIVLAFGLLWIA